MTLPWHPSTQAPRDRQLCLIVYHGVVVPDIFIYRAATDTFNSPGLVAQRIEPKPKFDICDQKTKRSEIDAWICKNELPLPVKRNANKARK